MLQGQLHSYRDMDTHAKAPQLETPPPRCYPNPFGPTASVSEHVMSSFGDFDFEGAKETARAYMATIAAHVKRSCNPFETHKSKKDRDKGSWDVYHGHAGLALLYLRLHEKDPGLLVDGSPALTMAEEHMKLALSLVNSNEDYVRQETGSSGHVGFIGSAAGVYAIAIALYYHLGNAEYVNTYLTPLLKSSFAKGCLSSNASTELLYGRPGYLYALLFVEQALKPCVAKSSVNCCPPPPPSQNAEYTEELAAIRELITNLHHLIIEDGKAGAQWAQTLTPQEYQATLKSLKTAWPLLWAWHSRTYLGAAHGVAGNLTMLLRTL
ncbi:LanC-like protein 2, partial [Chytridiales sp. JEL 0842]